MLFIAAAVAAAAAIVTETHCLDFVIFENKPFIVDMSERATVVLSSERGTHSCSANGNFYFSFKCFDRSIDC